MPDVEILYTHRYPDVAALTNGHGTPLELTEKTILAMLDESFRDGLRDTLRLIRAAKKRRLDKAS